MKKVFLDFETRSKCDLKKSGAFKYASDPSTEILCACWSTEDDTEEKYWSPFLMATDKITSLFDLMLSGKYEIEAHNAHFEWAMWNYCAVKKYNFPKTSFTQYSCTAARAAVLSLPRDLETLARVLGLNVQKDMVGNRIMRKMCKPNKEGKWHEDINDFEKLIDYCKQDVIVTKQVSKILPELSETEKKIFQLDFKINRKGVLLDLPLIARAAQFAEIYSEGLNSELCRLTNAQVTSATQNMKLTCFLQENGVDVDSVDKENITEALKNVTEPTIKRVLEIRQALALSSVKKLYSMFSMAMRDHRARGTLVYCGANKTARWSGKGIQIQNLPRGTLSSDEITEALTYLGTCTYAQFEERYPDVLGTISSLIRSFIKAPEGLKLMIGDFSAIEAKMVFWLAEHEKGLDIYRSGKDPYKEMAAYVYKKKYEDVTKQERQLGKAIILACGFGMGASKFQDTASKAPYNIELTKQEAKDAVEAYRTKHETVKKMWYALDNACKDAIKNPSKIFNVGKVSVSKRGNFLFIKLPSGRKISYFKPFLRTVEKDWGTVEQISFWGIDQETHKWGLIDTYGGKLVENATQACARDLMAFAMIKLDEAEYDINMLVHDEIVSETDEGTIEEYKQIMETLPDWAHGFPKGAEVEEVRRYKK